MRGMVFGNCSGGAGNTTFFAYTYDQEHGYRLARCLSMDVSHDNAWEGARYTETFYEDGEITDSIQTTEDLSASGFWKDYNDYTYEYVFG